MTGASKRKGGLDEKLITVYHTFLVFAVFVVFGVREKISVDCYLRSRLVFDLVCLS